MKEMFAINPFVRVYQNKEKGILILSRDIYNFIFGWTVSISIFALYTDFLGKEKYIESLNVPGGWLDETISIPLYSLTIAVCVWLFIKTNRPGTTEKETK